METRREIPQKMGWTGYNSQSIWGTPGVEGPLSQLSKAIISIETEVAITVCVQVCNRSSALILYLSV